MLGRYTKIRHAIIGKNTYKRGERQVGEEAIQYERGMTFEKVWAALMETRANDERRAREFEREMQELRMSIQETDRQSKESAKRMEESAKRLDKQLGKLGNRLGELIEELLVPDTLAKFNAMGYTFTKICPNVTIKNKDGKELAEIDFMLENGDYVLAGEVKLQPNAYDVKDHVVRMKKVRAYSDERGDTRKLIGAVAGALFPEDVKKYSQAAGFFVITAAGEDVNIETPPVGWEPKTDWI